MVRCAHYLVVVFVNPGKMQTNTATVSTKIIVLMYISPVMSHEPRVSVQGVESLWGDCSFQGSTDGGLF